MTATARPGAPDPTAVVGRRFAAAAIDVGIFWIFAVTYWLLVSEEAPSRGLALSDPCRGHLVCTNVNDRYVEGWPVVLLSALFLAYWVGVFVLQRGLTGRTVGTMVTGVAVVGPDGQPLGPGRALLRTVAGVVDYLPCCVPLVGIITVLASPGHRRVGDMAADSHVVGSEWFGVPVELPGPPVPGVPSTPPPDGYPAQPPIPPASRPPSAPSAPPAAVAPWTPTPSASPPPAPAPAPAGPTWDPERRAYVQWDEARRQWLQFDQAAQEWQRYDATLGRWRPLDS